jgi:hypothetical protein
MESLFVPQKKRPSTVRYFIKTSCGFQLRFKRLNNKQNRFRECTPWLLKLVKNTSFKLLYGTISSVEPAFGEEASGNEEKKRKV